jgi:hypothetical protein
MDGVLDLIIDEDKVSSIGEKEEADVVTKDIVRRKE